MMTESILQGLGIGWRPEIAWFIAKQADIRWLEVTAESVSNPRWPDGALLEARERGLTIVPHGIKLSLGSVTPPEQSRIDHLARLAEAFGSPLVSEHIAFTHAEGIDAGHLMPVPRTEAQLEVMIENVRTVQKTLPVPIALENISMLIEWPDAEIEEAVFIRTLLEETDSLMLLDVANVWANAKNFGTDPIQLLGDLPLERVAYCHIGGGFERDGVYYDTHAAPVPEEVFELLGDLANMATRPLAAMLERDDIFPPEDELREELARISQALAAAAS